MRRHLCVDVRLYESGGIGTYLKSLLPFLTDYELTLLVNEPIPFPARQIQLKSRIYTIGEQVELPRKIPSCDLFWSPHFNIPVFPIRAKKRLVTIHDLCHLAHFNTLTLAQKVYAKTVFSAAIRLSDQVITISHFSASELERFFFKPKSLEIIPCSPLIQPIARKSRSYLLYVGNLKPHKNLERLEKAHAELPQSPPLFIARQKLGYIPDASLPSLYADALLLCFPSTYEGFGLPPLEAMACGVPVLAGRAGAIPEICGDAVEYVDPYSISSIKKGLESLLFNPSRREELVKKGYERVKEYTPEKAGAKLLQVIDACCRRS